MVLRESLLGRLCKWMPCRLVLITGCAGFGKSMLMAQWRQRLVANGARVAWLSLDPSDSRPERFMAGLCSALAQAVASLDLATVQPREGEDTRAALLRLVNGLASLRGELYLMIDDYHRADGPEVGSLVQALIDAAVPGLHLVVASRAMPALQFGRLRAAGELAHLDSADLLFLPEETTAFLRKQFGNAVDADLACQLHDQAEGWPAGLQLLLEAQRKGRRGMPRKRADTAVSPALADYLAEDVLPGLPADLLEFLQCLSVLDRFPVDLAASATGVPQAGQMLDGIAKRGLFLLPAGSDEAGVWYRLHPMFAGYLRNQPWRDPSLARCVHGRAFEWFAQHGMSAQATHHALACGDPELIATLAERNLPVGTMSGVGGLGRLLERVPPPQWNGHSRLLRIGAWASVLSVQPAQARTWLALLGNAPDDAASARECQLLRAMLAAYRDDPSAARTAMERAGDAPLEDGAFAERLRLALRIWWLATEGNHAAARGLFNSRAARVLRRSTDELALLGVATAVLAAMLEGNVLLAERIGSPALAQAETRHGRRSISACVCAAAVATAWYEMDRIDDACQALANRMDRLLASSPEVTWRATVTKARLISLQETPRAALEYLAAAEAHWRAVGLERGIATMLSEQVRIALTIRDVRHAADLQRILDDIGHNPDAGNATTVEVQALADISAARLALATGAPAQALSRLSAAQAWAGHYGRGADQVTVTLLQGMAYDYLGRPEDASQSLIAAIASGYRPGLQRTFHDEGERLCRLLESLRGRLDGELAAYLDTLIGPARDAGAAGDVVSAMPAGQPKRQSSLLSEREIEIVSLLAQSMSNKRIALVLDLSIQTVKWNLKRVFAKLGVSSRYEAVVAARAHGLRLDPPQ
nr:LuxR C-terminal-related transcriptional regulator [Cupriavidus necator]